MITYLKKVSQPLTNKLWYTWKTGDQCGGYSCMTLFRYKDYEAHLVKVKKGQMIEGHINECCPTKELHKIVVVLKEAQDGGQFQCPGAMINMRRIKYMIPSKMWHHLERVDEGETLMLFLAWCKNKRV